MPRGKVRRLIIGGNYRGKLIKAFLKYDVSAIWFPNNNRVDERFSGHVDLGAVHMGGDRLVLSKSIISGMPEYVDNLTNAGLKVIESAAGQGKEYPFDINLNVCIISDILFHSLSYTDPVVLEEFGERKTFNVKQGYTKCSVCVVDRNSIITSDKGIAEAAEICNLEVLLIKPGHIALEGCDTGFIGGASFKLSNDMLAFTGSLKGHPDFRKIEQFVRSRGIVPVFLTDEPIFDIGGAIPITEEY